MKSFTCVVTDEMGLHARPAGLIAKKTAQYQSKVTLKCGDKEAACNRLIAIMKMTIKKGESVTFEIEGPDEDSAYADLKQFCEENL